MLNIFSSKTRIHKKIHVQINKSNIFKKLGGMDSTNYPIYKIHPDTSNQHDYSPDYLGDIYVQDTRDLIKNKKPSLGNKNRLLKTTDYDKALGRSIYATDIQYINHTPLSRDILRDSMMYMDK